MDEDKEKKEREKALDELEERNPYFSRHKYKTIYPEPADNSIIIKEAV